MTLPSACGSGSTRFPRPRSLSSTLQLLLDILRIEDEPACWAPLATIAAAEIEQRTRLGALDAAASLVVRHHARAAA